MNGRLRATLSIFGPVWWIAAVFVATVWVSQRYEVVRIGHRIEQLQAHLDELVKARDALLADNASLSSRARIEAIAINDLGMAPTREAQRVRLPRSFVSPGEQMPGQPGVPSDARRDAPRYTQAKAGIQDGNDF